MAAGGVFVCIIAQFFPRFQIFSAKNAAEERTSAVRTLLRRPILFCTSRCGIASRTYFFLACQKKVCKNETPGPRIALTRRKNLSFRSAFCRYTSRSPNALRAAVQSGFPSARYTVRVALFAPVEYLTYGSRGISNTKRFVGADAPSARLHRRVFRLPRRSIKDASVARFVNLKSPQHKLNSGENPRKGAAAPFLVVLRGFAKGTGLPRESSEAIRVGKGGTTERTTPVRRKRRTG